MRLLSRPPLRHLAAFALLGALVLSRASLAGPAAPPACPLAKGAPWHRATSTHFHIRTSLDEDSARRAARELERLRDALRSMWGPAFDPPGRVDVLLLRGRELAEFTEQHVGGFLAEDENDVPLLVMGVRGERFEELGDRPTLAHELAHYLTRFVLLRDSRWVTEGLATFLETVRLGEGPAGTVLGHPHPDHLKYLRAHGVLTLETLWRWDERPELEDPRLRDLYASSWLWVHYLFGMHLERLTRFEQALYEAREPRRRPSATRATWRRVCKSTCAPTSTMPRPSPRRRSPSPPGWRSCPTRRSTPCVPSCGCAPRAALAGKSACGGHGQRCGGH
jgi:hypothetical protein